MNMKNLLNFNIFFNEQFGKTLISTQQYILNRHRTQRMFSLK